MVSDESQQMMKSVDKLNRGSPRRHDESGFDATA
jgi:hypothetical protein